MNAQITPAQRELLQDAKAGIDIYPIHRAQGLEYLELQRMGLVHVAPPRAPHPDAIPARALQYVTLTPLGREAAGLQGECETCGEYDHDLSCGLCCVCRSKFASLPRTRRAALVPFAPETVTLWRGDHAFVLPAALFRVPCNRRTLIEG